MTGRFLAGNLFIPGPAGRLEREARQVTASTRLSYHHVADLQVPITCTDVAVYPGDIVVGDGDGVTVIPRHLAAEMADLCERRDQLEKYLSYRIKAGEPLYGIYPPTSQVRADFEAWQRAGARPEDAAHTRARNVDVT